jgi:EmrB/QacA subfamily drug resistance transporter
MTRRPPRVRGTETLVETGIAASSPSGRWIVAAAVLGSGIAFLDGSVVNVALPAIGRELGGGFSILQWILDGYLLTLSALLLLGGALGDRYGRRAVFSLGLVAFTIASVGCGLAPTGPVLVAARLLQGLGGALLIPGSLALLNAAIRPADRGRAIGTWAGWSGVASALGPFVGGWLVDAASWRWIFLINVPLAAVALWITRRHVPESRDPAARRTDVLGAVTITAGLAGVIVVLIEVPARGWSPLFVVCLGVGIAALLAFPIVERRAPQPLIPLQLFRSARFTGANIVTLLVYAALSGVVFLLALQLQQSMGYSALSAGLALLPFTVIMLLLSGPIGALTSRTGPRAALIAGPLLTGLGVGLLVLARPGATYLTGVLPGVALFGLGMAVTVAPLTTTVLAAVGEEQVGAASGANNAVSRVAGLLAVAVLPLVTGLDTAGSGPLGPGYAAAMLISAALCVIAAGVAAVTVRGAPGPVPPPSRVHPGLQQACAPQVVTTQ